MEYNKEKFLHLSKSILLSLFPMALSEKNILLGLVYDTLGYKSRIDAHIALCSLRRSVYQVWTLTKQISNWLI